LFFEKVYPFSEILNLKYGWKRKPSLIKETGTTPTNPLSRICHPSLKKGGELLLTSFEEVYSIVNSLLFTPLGLS